MKFRLASYNLENLFGRTKLLNLKTNDESKGLLNKVESLKTELGKKTYTDAVKTKILELHKELKEYIEIVETRDKLFKRSGFAIKGVKAGGKGDWSGFISFKKDKLSETAIGNSAKIVREVSADVLCAIEVENRPSMVQFASEWLGKPTVAFKKYDHAMCIDGNDPRGIDVGLLTRFPIVKMISHVDDMDDEGRIFSRDCFEVHLQLKKGVSLHLLINHLKSKGYGKPAESDAKRFRQATQIAKILKNYDLSTDLVAVVGDLNDTPGSAPLQPLLSIQKLTDVLEWKYPDPKDRWTYHYKKNEQIDYVLGSKALAALITDAGVNRRGIHELDSYTVSGETSLPSIKHWTHAASDHGAVWADFDL